MAWAIARGYGLIVGLTLLGLALRLLWIADSPPLLHRDEAVSLVDAWQLARTGRDHLGHLLPLAAFEAYGDWISPLLTYLLLPWIALVGPQPLAARLVVAIFGALAVPCVYGLVRELRLPAAAPWAALVAALSPWQIFLSRVSIPPALVATCWTLCIWAAIRFVRAGRRRDAIWLAIAAGIGLYSYPPMKLAVPLLLALALALALWRHGWRDGWRWWPAALALALLWSPFAASTLLNPDSGARLQLIGIKAASPGEWLAIWWSNYTVYFQPNLYYLAGGIRKIAQGMPDHGMALGCRSAAAAWRAWAAGAGACTEARWRAQPVRRSFEPSAGAGTNLAAAHGRAADRAAAGQPDGRPPARLSRFDGCAGVRRAGGDRRGGGVAAAWALARARAARLRGWPARWWWWLRWRGRARAGSPA